MPCWEDLPPRWSVGFEEVAAQAPSAAVCDAEIENDCGPDYAVTREGVAALALVMARSADPGTARVARRRCDGRSGREIGAQPTRR
jgi:hypothetical protein